MADQEDTTTEGTDQSLSDLLNELIEKDYVSITEEKDGRIYRIHATKKGIKAGKSADIKDINNTITRGITTGILKRIYRRKEDLDNPEFDAKAEINRTTKKISTRVSPRHEALFNEAAGQHPNKRAALERAIELLARESGLDIDS